MSESAIVYRQNGKVVTEEEFKSTGVGFNYKDPGTFGQSTGGAWPLCSDAAGVHPSQSKEAYDASVACGVPTKFNGQGQAVFTSRGHRRDYLRSQGLVDRQGGYSD